MAGNSHPRQQVRVGKIAVLVDAGYLLTAASEAVSGRSLKRHLIKLSADEAVLAQC